GGSVSHTAPGPTCGWPVPPPRRRRRPCPPGTIRTPPSRRCSSVRDGQEARQEGEQDPEDQAEQVEERQRDRDLFGPHERLLLTNADAGAEPAPEHEEIGDAADAE